MFHPRPGPVELTIGGPGQFRACPTDAMGMPVSGDASSSWSRAWPPQQCLRVSAAQPARLPTAPDAHVGIVLFAETPGRLGRAQVTFNPQDGFAAYRLMRVTAQPALLRAGARAGNVAATVYDECTEGITFQVTGGRSDATCRATVSGTISGASNEGIQVKSADGSTVGPTPLIVVLWPSIKDP